MKKAIKNQYPLVYLEWCDAMSSDDRWISIDDALQWGSNEDWTINQTGFLLKETKEYLLLAAKLNPHSQNNEIMISQLVKIPKTWIRKRVNLSKKTN